LRDPSICPHDGDPVNPDEPGYLSEWFTTFWFDDPGDDNWIANHPAHPDYITDEEEFDQLVACYLEDDGWQQLPDDSYRNDIGGTRAGGGRWRTADDRADAPGQDEETRAVEPSASTQACWPLVIVGGWEPHNTGLFGDLRLRGGGGARRGLGH
jgi:hypothetical protein